MHTQKLFQPIVLNFMGLEHHQSDDIFSFMLVNDARCCILRKIVNTQIVLEFLRFIKFKELHVTPPTVVCILDGIHIAEINDI